MAELSNQRVAYYNGKYMPESQVLLPFRDRGFKWGDGVYDTTRTFDGRLFKITEHVDRLYRSLRYLRIDPGLSPKEMIEISENVLARNLHLKPHNNDFYVSQRISRGVDAEGDEGWPQQGATVIVETPPLPLRSRAKYFKHGVDLLTSPVRRTSPSALSPRAKTLNKLNLLMAEAAVTGGNPNAWSLLLDEHGNIAEAKSANFFLVDRGRIKTARERMALPGISRQTVIELAEKLGIPCEECEIDPFDAANADEAFVTGTSYGLIPVKSIDGVGIGDGSFGPISRRLLDAFMEYVNFDFETQLLAHA